MISEKNASSLSEASLSEVSPSEASHFEASHSEVSYSESRGIPPVGNTSTGWLKLIALFFMLIDHVGAVIYPDAQILRILGRIAFPVYCWCMIVGFHYTRSVPRYLGRILILGFISQPLYAVIMNHLGMSESAFFDLVSRIPEDFSQIVPVLNAIFNKPSVLFTLFFGLLGLWGIREKKYYSHIWGTAAAILLVTLIKGDYGWKGVLFIILLHAVRGSRSSIAAVMVAYFLFWGTSFSIVYPFPLPFTINDLPDFIRQPVGAFLHLETYGLLSLPLILIPFKKKLRLSAWIGYSLYPAHLLLVLLLKQLLL